MYRGPIIITYPSTCKVFYLPTPVVVVVWVAIITFAYYTACSNRH